MSGQRQAVIAVFMFGLSFAPSAALAAGPEPLAYDLYSWSSGPNWRFSIFQGTTTARSSETIQAKKSTLRNATYLKGRLANLQRKDVVYWRERPAQGLRLPSAEIVQDIQRYMETSQVILVLPGDKPGAHPSLPPD